MITHLALTVYVTLLFYSLYLSPSLSLSLSISLSLSLSLSPSLSLSLSLSPSLSLSLSLSLPPSLSPSLPLSLSLFLNCSSPILPKPDISTFNNDIYNLLTEESLPGSVYDITFDVSRNTCSTCTTNHNYMYISLIHVVHVQLIMYNYMYISLIHVV